MISVFSFALLTLALLGALYLLSRRARKEPGGANLLRTLSAESLLPQHFKYFPQVRQALSDEDAGYLELRATSAARRSARQARRIVALEFLTGLRDDYRRLDRLARVLASLAPAANQQREAQRIWLACQFELRWTLIWLELWSGASPVTQLQGMVGLIGTLAARMEASINALQESADPTIVSV
jgi:hypothetical protein